MVDAEIIKDLYSKMTDEELVHFARNESTQLTAVSIQLLKAELELRKLNLVILDIENPTHSLNNLEIEANTQLSILDDFAEEWWNYALDEKEKGRPDSEIQYFLLQKGMAPEATFRLMQNLSAKAKERINNYETNIVMYWVSFFTAVILFILLSNHTLSATAGIYGLLLLIVSAIGGLKCYYAKKKYRTVLANIEAGEIDDADLLTNIG